MTVSSIKRLVAALAALMAVSAAAVAQNVPLRPEEVLVSPNAGQPAQAPASKGGGFPEAVSPRDVTVQVQTLAAIDAGSTGILTSDNGGFSADLWNGAQMAVVQKVMPALPAAASSRSLRLLMRKLLLTAAAVPAGPPAPGDTLTKIRADRLWAMGDVEELAAFLKGVPDRSYTPDLRRLAAEAALLAGDSDLACAQLSALRGPGGDGVFGDKLGVYCQFAAGKAKEAALSLDVLREQKISDPAFFVAADAMSGVAPGKLEVFVNQLSPLTLALARAAKIALPEAVVNSGTQPAILHAVATDPAATPEARLAAAEQAEAMGAVGIETLRQVYESVNAGPQDLAGAGAGADKSAKGRAILYRAVEQQADPVAKAALIGKALAVSGDFGPAYFSTARLYAAALQNIRPTPELAAFAYPAARALLAAGKTDAAKAWLRFLHDQMAGAPEAVSAVAGLWPILRMSAAEDGNPLPAPTLELWRAARAGQPGDIGQRRAAVCYSLLAALGEKVPETVWLPLYDGPAVSSVIAPRPAIWQGLATAAAEQRVGQAVLMALAGLGDGGLSRTDPSELYRVVWALKKVGLDAEARALAVEAAIANGV